MREKGERTYRIRNCGWVLEEGRLLVRIWNGPKASVRFDDGEPVVFNGDLPSQIEVDGTGTPRIADPLPTGLAIFGTKVTTLVFHGDVHASGEDGYLVVTSSGTPKITTPGAFPAKETELVAANQVILDGDPHSPRKHEAELPPRRHHQKQHAQ